MRTDAQKIDEIMDWFDFDKVHRAMMKLNWTWATTKGVPEAAQLRINAREHLDICSKYFTDVLPGYLYACGSGGLEASLYVCPDGERIFALQFILEEWDNRV